MLVLYSATLLHLLVLAIFYIVFSVFLMQDHVVYKQRVLFFLSNSDIFIFLALLLWLVLSVLCWIEVVDWASLPCSWSERKNLHLFTIEYDISCGLFMHLWSLLCWGKFLVICWEFLSWNGVELHQMLFLHLLRWSCDFYLHSINVVYPYWTVFAFQR